MSRGPVPVKAREESLYIAERRGLVQCFQRRRGNICDFSVMSPGLVSFVCAMRLVTLSSTLSDILHDFAAVIGRLRFIVSSLAISRELWLRTPRGMWRFFRILDDTIIELDRDGVPLANGVVPVKPSSPTRTETPGSVPGYGRKTGSNGQTLVGKDPEPEKNPAEVRSGVSAEKDSVLKSLTNPGPENNPAPAVKSAGPLPGNTGQSGTVPARLPVPEKNPVNPEEPDMSRIPGINLELIRRFMRWRKENHKNDPARVTG